MRRPGTRYRERQEGRTQRKAVKDRKAGCVVVRSGTNTGDNGSCWEPRASSRGVAGAVQVISSTLGTLPIPDSFNCLNRTYTLNAIAYLELKYFMVLLYLSRLAWQEIVRSFRAFDLYYISSSAIGRNRISRNRWYWKPRTKDLLRSKFIKHDRTNGVPHIR